MTNAVAAGIFSLTSLDTDVTAEPGWSNPNINGVALRATWAHCEPDQGVYQWDLIDSAVAAAESNGKPFALSFTAGIESPAWLYPTAAPFDIQNEGTMPTPWDEYFQAAWQAFANAAAAQYGANPLLAYVTLSGLGYLVESYFVKTPQDCAAATAGGFAPTWIAAGKSIIDAWCTAFPNTLVTLATGQPYAGGGLGPMTQVSRYGIATYPQTFGLKSCLLSATYPNGIDFVHTTIPISPALDNTLVVYQMVSRASNPKMNGTLDAAMQLGIDQGANALEIYSVDCANQNYQAALSEVNQTLLSFI